MPAPSANVLSTRYARITTTTKAADGTHDMAGHVQDDAQESGSVVSGLTSLEGDDDFERLMIQNARDERRLAEALHGRAQPFRKARAHARVGLTIGNLERNDAQNNDAFAANARVAIKSPPSSSGSTRSDPAIRAPAAWGRKGRTSRNWLRSITRDEQPHQTRALPHETVVEDSPLSHKSFHQGTPRNDNSGEWDLTFDMNEASMLASTPYIPRNTKLDDIRERETESLREQGAAAARLDGTRESSPEEMRRPRSSAAKPTNTNSTADPDAQSQEQGSPLKRLRKRTNSWQSLSRSQPEPGQSQPELGQENSPITVYRKSVETVGVVERGVVASAERQPARPFSNRRTDSQDLLRRLARASNTPSPKATMPARPQTDPALQPHSSSQTVAADTSYKKPDRSEEATKATPVMDTAAASTSTPQEQPQHEQRYDTPHDGTTPDVPSSAPTTEDIDATPLPVEPIVRQPKTPYVMGGWVDTPGPRTSHKPVDPRRPPSQSPRKRSTSKKRSPERSTASTEAPQPVEEVPEPTLPSLPRPQLPGSALHALVQAARANHDYGDDTIHSLEDLMTPLVDNEAEEDTLQGLPLPTSAPRTEAERGRQSEVVVLHRLHQHLRSTTTSLRDVSRSMSRAETRAEHIEVEGTGEKVSVIVRDSHEFSPWRWFRSFFWDERLKTQRGFSNTPLKMWGGVTILGIFLTVSFIWWASETVACEIFCHPEYASYSPYPFAVNMDAPKRGVVIPTLVYRALFKSWSTSIVSPVASLLSWIWASLWRLASGINITGLSRPSYEAAANGGAATAAHTQTSWKIQEEAHEEDSWDWSMAEDEVLRR